MSAKILILFAFAPSLALGGGFLHSQRAAGPFNEQGFQKDIEAALQEVQGCGGHVQLEQLADVERRLLPMWRSLPKTGEGRVERPLLRHVVHRYFRQRYSFIIRGFEESRPAASDPTWGVEQALSERVPAHLEAVLSSSNRGFALADAVRVVAALEELILEHEVSLLDDAYDMVGVSPTDVVDEARLMEILQAYLDLWVQHDLLPEWDKVVDFALGEVRALAFRRGGGLALSGAYTLLDAREVVKAITTSFGSFFKPVCDRMLSEPLERMDTQRSGRIPLGQFYKASRAFSETAEHLRAAGALDESGRTPQVLIANYVLGTSNCYVATPHYMVCCASACEGLHGEIEQAVGGALAAPKDLLALVGNMSQTAAWDAEDAGVSPRLAEQLGEIAAVNGGEVPLHGRLFAQWLHHAFPRECPFPHKAGTVVAAGPSGRDTPIMSEEEKRSASESAAGGEEEEEGWIPQWSMDEELMSDYEALRRPSRGRSALLLGGAALLLVAGLLGAGAAGGKEDVTARSRPAGCLACKAHLV